MSKWFLNQHEKVSGPLSTDEVKARVAGGLIAPECLIWGRTLEGWRPVSRWMSEVAHMAVHQKEAPSLQMWHYAVDGDSRGPLSRTDLVRELQNIRNSTEILVWTKGMKAWADLYEFHDLLDEAGINRREHPRAPISGSVVVKSNDQTIIGLLKSISPGGFGATQIGRVLSIGEIVSVEIKSEKLGEQLSVRATVQYASETGFYGFKFVNINMEAKAHIMQYIKSNRPAAAPSAAA